MSEAANPPVAISFWKTPLQWWAVHTAQRQGRLLLALSVLIGALTGLAVVALILMTERLGMRLYLVNSPAWHRVLIPVVGSLAMGWVLFRYFPEARGSGVAQTKAAIYIHDGVITLRAVFGKFFCTSATLASGIPLGPEGPSVYVGAGIASVLARRLGLRSENVKSLIPVGAAAAIAAAFNTPLAAVVYSLEEIVGDLNAPVLGSVVLASATSWMVLRLLLGNNPLFHAPQYELVHDGEFAIYAVLGLAGGLISALFMKLLFDMRALFQKLPARTVWMQPLAGGLLVGIMGLWMPRVLGVGYSYVGDALNGRMALKIMAILLVLKFLSIITSSASGNAGGLFAPSLFLGAMAGGVVGSIAHHFWPAYTAVPGAYAMVGMGALFAGIMRAPMTSVLMIFETTHDYAVIVPLMIANMVSFFISSKLQPAAIYQEMAIQEGLHMPASGTRRRAEERQAAHVMRGAEELLLAAATVTEALSQVSGSSLHAWPVMEQRSIVGIVSAPQLQKAAENGGDVQCLRDLVTAQDFPHVHADQPLHIVLERMGSSKLDLLPVVSRANVHDLIGIVLLPDVLNDFGVGPFESKSHPL
jgi:chloride channel protein, CIC family